MPYTQYTYTYVAISSTTRITFAFREDLGFFLLDDISVVNINSPNSDLIVYGGFENGALSPSWDYCDPVNSTSEGFILSNTAHLIWDNVTFLARTGSYCYADGIIAFPDYLSQTFATQIGATYNISYWLFNRGSGTNSSADVFLST